MADLLSWPYSTCYYLNALMGIFDFLNVSRAFQSGSTSGEFGIWITIALFTLVAYLTWVVAKQLLRIKSVLEHEHAGPEIESPWLGGQVVIPDTSIPGLIQSSFGGRIGKWMHFLSLLICLAFTIGLICFYADFIAKHVLKMSDQFFSWKIDTPETQQAASGSICDTIVYGLSILLIFGPLMSVICPRDLRKMKRYQVGTTVCRILLILLMLSSPWFIKQTPPKPSEPELGVFFFVFLYHITIPGILKESAPGNQRKANALAIGPFYLILLIYGLICAKAFPDYEISLHPSFDEAWRDRNPVLSVVVMLFYLVLPLFIALSVSHIYFRTFQALLVSALLDANSGVAEEAYEDRWNYIYWFAPWVFYVILFIYRVIAGDGGVWVLIYISKIPCGVLIFLVIPIVYRLVEMRKPWSSYLGIYLPFGIAVLCFVAQESSWFGLKRPIDS